MIDKQTLLLCAILVPLAGALFLPWAQRISSGLRNILALLLTAAPLVCSVLIAPLAFSQNPLTFSTSLPLGFNFSLQADALGVCMACISSLISVIIVIYSFSYIRHYPNQNEYYSMVVMFIAAMTGLIYSANLILLYIFWEITAIVSWRLIGFFREKEFVLKADKAFLMTVGGALLMLLGFIILNGQYGTLELPVLKEMAKANAPSAIAIVFILAGMFSKSAILPFQSWLPDAGVAPSPVTALLHAAVLVKIGVYVFARLFVVSLPFILPWTDIVMLIAGASSLVSAGAALVETDLKRIIAYSTISQIGFIFLGFANFSLIGVTGSLLYILMHGLGKAGLFLCAGIVEQNTLTKDITKLGGLIKTMPWTAAAFLLCALSIMGVPPLGGFFSKYMVIASAISANHFWYALLFLGCAMMTVLYLMRVFAMVFLGEEKIAAPERSFGMVACVCALALLSLLAGIFINYPSSIMQNASLQMLAGK